jgi:hypothetical protein
MTTEKKTDTSFNMDLRPLVAAAVKSYDAFEPQFIIPGFAFAVKERFALAKLPDHRWCIDTLSKLPYVTALPGDRYAYKR